MFCKREFNTRCKAVDIWRNSKTIKPSLTIGKKVPLWRLLNQLERKIDFSFILLFDTLNCLMIFQPEHILRARSDQVTFKKICFQIKMKVSKAWNEVVKRKIH